ncbi:MAG: hypothetical protein WCF04_09355, partial [Candidatus Nanopelagicales bacterium]
MKKAASTVQRLRGWVGTDPTRTPELADALVRLTETRLRANSWTEAAPDAQDSVVLAGKLLASHGPLGPYTPLADAVRFVTATVQLADTQVGLGLPEAAGRTLQAALAVRAQLSRLDLDHELDATTRCRALLVLAEAALAGGDVPGANAHADAALAARIDLPPDLLTVRIARLLADCRWAAGWELDAVAWAWQALADYDALVGGRLDDPGRVSPVLLERVAEPLFGAARDAADRLAACGEQARG